MKFSSIVGHNELKQQLVEMANAGRTGHAVLFWGDEGVGALPLALGMVQQMLCRQKEEGEACGKCASCNKVQKIIHPDLHFAVPVNSVKPSDRNPVTDHYMNKWRDALLENTYLSEHQWYNSLGIDNKNGNISVHEADAILKKLSFKPYEGDYKFMVIWLPERMNIQASNTLLKILEEPPSGTYFFLITEHPEQLLTTIRSRCQNVRINPVAMEELAPVLARNLSVTPDEAMLLARISGGSYGKACARIQQDEVREELSQGFFQLIDYCLAKNLLAAIQWAEEVSALGREKQRRFLLHAFELLRESYIIHIHALNIACADTSESARMHAWSGKLSDKFFQEAYMALNGGLADIDRNVNAKMTFYSIALRFFLSL